MSSAFDSPSGFFTLSGHLIFETLAFIAGFRYYLQLRKRQTDLIPEANRNWIIVGAAAGAMIGSRVLSVLEDPTLWLASSNPLLLLYSSKTIVGGLLGGLAGVEITKYFLKENSSSGDLFTYPIILGMMIGRVGCFLAGLNEQTFGVPSSLPWAIDLGDGIPRHPVTLYEIAFLGVLWFILHSIGKKYELQNGMRFKLFMVGYLFFRFFLDFIKPAHPVMISLSSIQIACVLGLLYYYRVIVFSFVSPSALLRYERPA